jgi:hypothetical protein
VFFGGLAPLPLRLTESRDGVSAAQYARLCADLVSLSRTAPAFVLVVDVNTTTHTVTVTSYEGRNGMGIQFAPLVTESGGYCVVDMTALANAAGFAVDMLPWTGVKFSTFITRRSTRADVPTTNASNWDGKVTFACATDTYLIEVYANTKPSHIGDYGGHLEKRNCKTEALSTYAAAWYRMMKPASGTAYTMSDTSVRSWLLKAEARAFGTSQRISEMLASSATPGGSDLLLDRWAKQMHVQRGQAPAWQIRQQCEDKFSNREPVTLAALTARVSEILGQHYSGIRVTPGTISAPPDATYVPGYRAGDALYDISGRGVFSSPRAKLTILIEQGATPDNEVADLVHGELAEYLGDTLQSTTAWQWARNGSGFILGTSKLGLDAL